jgi:hypothetical protein
MTFITKLMVEYVIIAFMIACGLRLLGFHVTNINEFVYGLIGVSIIMSTIPVTITISKWAFK